jgi:hypothetical protein
MSAELTMKPVLVILRSTLFRAFHPDGHVLLDDGGHEVVEHVFSLRWERLREWILFAQVGVMTHR